jgi:hypothetical protein
MKINGEVYRQAVKNIVYEKGFKACLKYSKRRIIVIINAEYKRLAKARSKREHRRSNKTHK